MEKHCCSRIKGLYDVDKNYGPNFRVIEITDKYKELNLKRGVAIKEDYKYIITQGYTDVLSSDYTNILFINFCPFCGKKLSKYYHDKSYINEIHHVW